jgi:hypothetical protein
VEYLRRENKDLLEMNNNHNHLLSSLKPLVVNPQEWDKFNNYIEDLIANQHRTMEQTDETAVIYRAQGAIHTLRRLLLLREEVLQNGSNG